MCSEASTFSSKVVSSRTLGQIVSDACGVYSAGPIPPLSLGHIPYTVPQVATQSAARRGGLVDQEGRLDRDAAEWQQGGPRTTDSDLLSTRREEALIEEAAF